MRKFAEPIKDWFLQKLLIFIFMAKRQESRMSCPMRRLYKQLLRLVVRIYSPVVLSAKENILSICIKRRSWLVHYLAILVEKIPHGFCRNILTCQLNSNYKP